MLATRRFMLAVALLLLPLAAAFSAPSPDPQAPVRFRYLRADLDDVLYLYSQLSGKPLHVDAGVGATVDIMSQDLIPRSEALAWLRRQLLDRYGVEIRDVPGSDIHVSWSADHDQVREATKRSLKTLPEARVIDIATLHAKKPH
jgi:hypothetical protein